MNHNGSDHRPQLAVLPFRPPPPERTLIDIIDATIRAHPDAPAIQDEVATHGAVRVLTYAMLAREVEALSARLRAEGIGVGDRVGVRMPSGTAEVYIAILAVLTCGAAYVPVDADDPEGRAEMVWAEARVCAVLGAEQVLERRAEVALHGGQRPPTPDDDAWIIFTSGTTGRPRGVAVTHRSAAAFVDAEARMFVPDRPIGPGDRVLAGFSVGFDASCEEMWLAWRNGAALVPAPRVLVRAGADLCPWLEQHRISVISTVPTLAALWSEQALSAVRLLILGGEACPPGLAGRFLTGEREVWNTYGPTETAVVASGTPLVLGETVRIGLPLDGWQLAVVDDEGRPVEWGEVGELIIGGVGVSRYLDPVKDAEKFTEIPWLGWSRGYHSGDLVLAERAGLVFIGRRDEQVKIRGHRVELTGISMTLSTHPAVRQAHVRAIDDEAGGKRLVAYVVADDVEIPELRRHLARDLPSAMMPDVFVLLAEMPITISGKIDAKALPMPRAAPEPQSRVIKPHASTEDLVAAIWCEVLVTDRVNLDDSFFEIGGHSLLLAQVQQRLTESLGRPIPAVALFAHPTVRSLAEYISGAEFPRNAMRPRSRRDRKNRSTGASPAS